MAYVDIEKSVNEAANRYGNLLPTKPERDYAFAYLGWLRNGAEGFEPKPQRLSRVKAAPIKASIDSMKPWEHIAGKCGKNGGRVAA